jgi:hypothetical protein
VTQHINSAVAAAEHLKLTMRATRAHQAQKRSAADSRNPLIEAGVLQHVLSYVGPGHCIYVAPVSSMWRDLYAKVKSQQLTVYDEDSLESIIINCVPQMTLYSSVFTSPSRVQLAHESGLDCTSEAYQRAAGKHADIATVATAHELGMLYTDATMYGAAQCNKLAEVQFLHKQGCPWHSDMLKLAASSGFRYVEARQQHSMQLRAAMLIK